jgi:hypothetical protein
MFRNIIAILALLWFGYSLVAMTDVTADFLPTMVSFLGGAVVFAFGIAQAFSRDNNPSARRLRPTLVRWLPLLLWAMSAALVMSGRGLLFRFLLSKTALTRYAHAVQTGKGYLPNSGMVGLFHIRDVKQLPDGTVRLTTSYGFDDMGGLLYSPSSVPELTRPAQTLISLGSHWWIWKHDA